MTEGLEIEGQSKDMRTDITGISSRWFSAYSHWHPNSYSAADRQYVCAHSWHDYLQQETNCSLNSPLIDLLTASQTHILTHFSHDRSDIHLEFAQILLKRIGNHSSPPVFNEA